jgi:DNA invertase Pin-like site-specific DNA recombinase
MADRLTSDQLEAMFRRASGHEEMPPGWTPVGAWVRVSSGAQDEENQVPAVIQYCTGRKYWPVVWYIVHAKSAFHGKHQGILDQAVDDMRSGKTAVLVIWHSDRLERRHDGKTKTLLGTLAEFGDAGGRVESTLEPTLGQLDFGGQVTTFITGLMNNEKSKHISQQVGIAFDRIRANGAVSTRPPWGFDTEGEKYNRRLIPTDECRTYAPVIFDRCIAGDSLRTIAKWLETQSVRPMFGGKWSETAVRNIIRNRVYAGRLLDSQRKTVVTCEAVISAATFERANKALSSRERRGPQAAQKPLLAKLKCPRCGSPMYRIHGAGRGKTYFYYRCFGSGAQRKGCGNMVRYERLENMVAVRMLAWHDEPHQIRSWVEGRNWDAEIADIVQSIRELDPTDRGYRARNAELLAELEEYQRLNDEESTSGRWDVVNVVNDDGSIMTRGQYFYGLYEPYLEDGDVDPAREYLMTFDIRAEKLPCCAGIHLIIEGREDSVHEEDCADAELGSGFPLQLGQVGLLPAG